MTNKRKIQNVAFHAGFELKNDMQKASVLHDINWSRYFRECAQKKIQELIESNKSIMASKNCDKSNINKAI